MKITLSADDKYVEFEANEEFLRPVENHKEHYRNIDIFWERYLKHAAGALGREIFGDRT